jgi:hypothetical protein
MLMIGIIAMFFARAWQTLHLCRRGTVNPVWHRKYSAC